MSRLKKAEALHVFHYSGEHGGGRTWGEESVSAELMEGHTGDESILTSAAPGGTLRSKVCLLGEVGMERVP